MTALQKKQQEGNKKLNVFVGKWHTTGEVAATATTPAMKIDASDIYEWHTGNYTLLHYIESKIGDEVISGIEMIGYDTNRDCYFSPFFDNQGSAGWEEITVKENTWIWKGKGVLGVNYHRCTAVFSKDGNSIKALHEKSEDGINWERWMDIVLMRIK